MVIFVVFLVALVTLYFRVVLEVMFSVFLLYFLPGRKEGIRHR